MEDDYSILPYPKLDETQENYKTGASDQYSYLGVPITVSDKDMVSVITEALNAESYRSLFPTYYEEALQYKYARDENAMEMISILMDGRNFDMVTLHAHNVYLLFRNVVGFKSTDFSSQYKTVGKLTEYVLGNIAKKYAENADR